MKKNNQNQGINEQEVKDMKEMKFEGSGKTRKTTKTIKTTKVSTTTGVGAAAKATNAAKATKGNTASAKAIHPLVAPPEMGDAPGFTHMFDYDKAMGEFDWVKNTEIVTNSEVLNLPSSLAVRDLLRHFDARLVDPIRVSLRDGKYIMIDGAKTYAMLVEMHKMMGIEEFEVMCRIYHDLEIEDEARIYATIDDLHIKLPTAYKIRALEVAQDKEILDFLEKSQDAGFIMIPGNYKSRNGHICAIASALDSYRKLGAKKYQDMLRLIHKTWGGASWSVNKNMLHGMSRFVEEYRINEKRFVEVFSRVSYLDVQMAAGRYPGMTKEKAFASGISDIYSHGPLNPDGDNLGVAM